MKTYVDFLKERFEGYTFTLVDNIREIEFEAAAEAYHEYRMEQYKKEGLILLPDRLTAENGAKALLIGEFIEICHDVKHTKIPVTVSWTTIKDIYKKIVEHYGK